LKRTQTIKTVILAVALILFIGVGVSSIVKHDNKLKFKEIEIKDTSLKLKQLEQKYDVELKQNTVDTKKVEELEKEKEELKKQLGAKQEAKRIADAQAQEAATRLANTVTQTNVAYAAPTGPVAGCSGDPDADFIYAHESGCNPSSVNSIGCRGIGQACPGSKLPCGADFACQHAYFTNYAVSRYGSWSAARAFWLQHSWW
jgi:hypothetical protein